MNINKSDINFLKGKKCILRPLEEKDINIRYLSWINDNEVTRYMETGTFPVTMKELRNFYRKIYSSRSDIIFAIVDKKKNLHIGNIKLGGINFIHRYADLGIMIGDKRYWGRGCGSEACGILLNYAFNKLNLNKVMLGVYGEHKSAIKAYKKAGFEIEGRVKKIFYLNGKYHDRIIMGISKKQFDRLPGYEKIK